MKSVGVIGAIKSDSGGNPDGAAIDTVVIMDEFRQERSGSTLGYRYAESVLPLGQAVLVVGAVSDATGQVVIGQPVQADHRYLISLKDEELLATATSRNAQNTGIAMFICLGLGTALLIWGLISKRLSCRDRCNTVNSLLTPNIGLIEA